MTFYLKNDIVNLVNFNLTSGKSENLHFDELLLWKVCNVWAKKIKKSWVVKNDLCFFVLFFSIWVFFHEHSRFIEQQGKGEGISLTPLSSQRPRFSFTYSFKFTYVFLDWLSIIVMNDTNSVENQSMFLKTIHL